MPSPHDDGGWRLPLDNDAPRICVVVPVPDDQNHRAAFVGVLMELSKWFNWQKDAAHGALEASAVWKEILEEVRYGLAEGLYLVCGDDVMDVRQNEENPCILEKTFNGLTWVPFADLTLCTPRLRLNPATGRLQTSPDGTTWTDVPNGPPIPGDPTEPTFDPPPRGESEADIRRCLAAANAARVLRQTYAEMGTRLAEEVVSEQALAASLEEIVGGFLTVIGIAAAATGPITLLTILGVFAVQGDYSTNPLTDPDEDELTCILFDASTDNAGSVTFSHGGVVDGLVGSAVLGTTKGNLLRLIVDMVGADGLNMAGTTTSVADHDCSTCEEWCYEGVIDYRTGLHGSSKVAADTGIWESGVGWKQELHSSGTEWRLQIAQPCSEAGLVAAVDVYVESGGNTGGVQSMTMQLLNAGAVVHNSGGRFIAPGTAPRVERFSLTPVTADEIRIRQFQNFTPDTGQKEARFMVISRLDVNPTP